MWIEATHYVVVTPHSSCTNEVSAKVRIIGVIVSNDEVCSIVWSTKGRIAVPTA